MPEVPICIHCRKPIRTDKDEYVVTNKDQVQYDNQWLYAHAACQEKRPN